MLINNGTPQIINAHDGYDPDDTSYNYTALQAASVSGNNELVNWLQSHNANVNTRGPGTQCPLTLAREGGHSEVVLTLHSAGAYTHGSSTNTNECATDARGAP